ncbi:MAG: hypothetical protein CM1200mP41_27740 [Gammaproteobacteria bacterium]|nr:MAG: hypothetical protein CM1200mP41_27740 [Gammaproteobacteria bacterium]
MAMTGPSYLLGQFSGSDEAEWNDWYEKQHMAARLEMPGFLCIRRFHLTSGQTPNPRSLVAPAYFSSDCVGVGCCIASMASALVIEVSQRLVYTIGPPLITRRSGLLRTVVR